MNILTMGKHTPYATDGQVSVVQMLYHIWRLCTILPPLSQMTLYLAPVFGPYPLAEIALQQLLQP